MFKIIKNFRMETAQYKPHDVRDLTFLIHYMKSESESVSRSVVCQILHPPGSSVQGILQASNLEGVVIPFSRGSYPPRD